MTELLCIEDLKLGFKRPHIPIIHGISFKVEQAKTTVILGESGAGKTMTIKAITNLLNKKNMYVQGKCLLEGCDIFSLSETERRKISTQISLVMQNPMTAFNPSICIARQMIEPWCKVTKLSVDVARQRALHALKSLNMPDPEGVLTAYPSELSGGMLQRVMIAIALMNEAKLLIADEPTTALDVLSQDLVVEEFEQLKQKGMGLLVITHNIFWARKIGDYIAVMTGGRIVEYGKAETVFSNPTHAYTKSLLAASTLKTLEELSC